MKIFNRNKKEQVVKKYEYASFQGIGAREQQQDSYFISRPEDGFDVEKKGLMLALADGMGGMDSGDKFSGALCDSIMTYFKNEKISKDEIIDDPEKYYFHEMVKYIDSDINKLKKDDEIGDGGSTLCCVHLNEGEMSYLSIGDSRIYLLRDGILQRVNKVHNLGSKCLEKLTEKEITWDDYRKVPGKEGLTSYVGEDEISEKDINVHMKLIPGDIIMIFSDGVFNTLSEEEIKAIAMKRTVVEAAYMFEEAVGSMMKEYQDNFTGIIIRCFE